MIDEVDTFLILRVAKLALGSVKQNTETVYFLGTLIIPQYSRTEPCV